MAPDNDGNEWDARKILDLYIHDYMVKKNMKEAAEIFKEEANVGENPVVDSPEGFLREWWSIFYDTYASRTPNNQEGNSEAESSVKDPMMMMEPSPQMNQEELPLDFEKMMFTNPSASGSTSSHLLRKVSENTSQEQIAEEDNGDGTSSGGSIISLDSTSHGAPRATYPSIGHDLDAGKNDVVMPIQSKVTEFGPYSFGTQHYVPNSLFSMPSQHQQFQTSQAMALSSLQGGSSNFNNQMLHMSDLRGQSSRQGGGIINAEANKPLVENFGSYLSPHENNIANVVSNSFTTFLRNSSGTNINEDTGIPFKEVGNLHSSRRELTCCHFSGDGKLLASSGHEKKIFIWNVDSFNCVSTSEGHAHIVTDVRFRPSSSVFATSSFDRTVQIWEASKPTRSISRLLGHSEPVVSLDFHPRRSDVLCSCDTNNEIRLWNIKQSACTRVFKGASRQVRFQPRAGNLLAAASGNIISLIDVETNYIQCHLEGHVKDVRSLCWDTSGKFIGSVSEESARIWSTGSNGKCIYELHSFGNKFESCIFHPGYSLLMVVGCHQSMELWNPTDQNDKTKTVVAHNGVVAALADSPYREMIASAGYDQLVKLWK